MRQLRVFNAQFGFRDIVGQQVKNKRHPDARAAYAGLPAADCGAMLMRSNRSTM
jgi:hypothetical protein